MTLINALSLSSIATLWIGDVRYFATNTRIYKEEYIKSGVATEVDVKEWSTLVINEEWEAMGHGTK